MEIKPKKDKSEVLMSDVTFIAWVSLVSLIFTATTLVLVIAVLVFK